MKKQGSKKINPPLSLSKELELREEKLKTDYLAANEDEGSAKNNCRLGKYYG